MLRSPTIGFVTAVTVVLGAALCLPAPAEARGRRVGRRVGVGGFYGPGPYGAWGAPYWGWGPAPYGYGMQQALLGYAMISGMGGLDLDVKPNRAEVWLDGRYLADARDLDGDPSYLWLKQGKHHVVLYEAGYESREMEVDVRAGVLQRLKVRLEKGESPPPVPALPEPRPVGPRSGIDVTQPGGELSVPEGEPLGEVGLRVEPRDATVWVDGAFLGPARGLGVLRLPAGRHRIDLARPGYRELSRELDVEAGRRSALALSMERGDGLER